MVRGRSRRSTPEEAGEGEQPAGERALNRRAVLQHGLTAAAALVGLPARLARAAPPAEQSPPAVRRYATLGRTGIKMSDISIGTGALGDPKLLRYAISRGVNYIDTADGYPLGAAGRAEKLIGRVLGNRRKDLILATKTNTTPDVRKEKLMRNLEASLRRLRTNYVDIYFNQAVNDPARVLNPEWAEFAGRAKQQGKIRFSGMSGHGGRLIECLDLALDQKLFDVILTAYNFGQDPAFYEKLTRNFDIVANQKGLPRVLAKAHAQGVGVIAMKTLMGAKLNDLGAYQKGGHTYAQAAFRWVLSNPDVDGLIISMRTRENVDDYLGASGARAVAREDLELLGRYVAANSRSYCRFGCSVCESSCPDGVQISDVLRSRMYAVSYGEQEMGRSTYASLETDATSCLSCSHQSCLGACPYGLPIPEMTKSAEALLARGGPARVRCA